MDTLKEMLLSMNGGQVMGLLSITVFAITVAIMVTVLSLKGMQIKHEERMARIHQGMEPDRDPSLLESLIGPYDKNLKEKITRQDTTS